VKEMRGQLGEDSKVKWRCEKEGEKFTLYGEQFKNCTRGGNKGKIKRVG